MSVTVIGNVPYWDSYYSEPGPQSWWTDGTSLYDDQGVAVAALGDASSVASSSGDTTSQGVISSLVSSIPGIITGWNSLQLSNLNMSRARSGLAPLNPAQFAPQVGVSLSSSTTSMIMMIAAGLGIVMLLKGKK